MDRPARQDPHRSGPIAVVPEDGATDSLLTADDVSSLLRVTKSWLYAETRAGRVPHVRLGRYVRYRRSAIERWLDVLEERSLQPVQRPRPTAAPRERSMRRVRLG